MKKLNSVISILSSVFLCVLPSINLMDANINTVKTLPDTNDQFENDISTESHILDLDAKAFDYLSLETWDGINVSESFKERKWMGTLNDWVVREMFLKSGITSYLEFDKEQIDFINLLTSALKIPASAKSTDIFNKFMSKKQYNTFDELVNIINNHNKNNPNAYIDVPLEMLRDNASDHAEFEKTMLKIYNVLALSFGKDYGYKVVKTLCMGTPLSLLLDPKSSPTGITCGGTIREQKGKQIQIAFNKNACLTNESLKENTDFGFVCGITTTTHMHNTIVHEFGHAIDFIHDIEFPFYEEIDSISGLSLYSSWKHWIHNEYKLKHNANLNKNKLSSMYKVNMSFFQKISMKMPLTLCEYIEVLWHISDLWWKYIKIKIKPPSPSFYHRSKLTIQLSSFLEQKIKNLKIPGKDEIEKNKFKETMLLKIFINSTYGRSLANDREVPSEGFAYWLLCPENERDKAWEIWNEFFLIHLPTWRKTATKWFEEKELKNDINQSSLSKYFKISSWLNSQLIIRTNILTNCIADLWNKSSCLWYYFKTIDNYWVWWF